MHNAFFIGVYPGLSEAMLGYMEAAFQDFFAAQMWKRDAA